MIQRMDDDTEFWCREKALANRRREFNRRRREEPATRGTPLLDRLAGDLRAISLAEQHFDKFWCCKECSVIAPAQDAFQRRQLIDVGWDAVREMCPDCQQPEIEVSPN